MSSQSDFETRIDRLDLNLFVPSRRNPTRAIGCPGWQYSATVHAVAVIPTWKSGLTWEGASSSTWWTHSAGGSIPSTSAPIEQPDDRSQTYRYDGNSTARMMTNLLAVSPGGVGKLTTFDSDASSLDPTAISDPPDFCFIDGEHTRRAVTSDFEILPPRRTAGRGNLFSRRCGRVSRHRRYYEVVKGRSIRFRAAKLGGETFGIFLRQCPAPDDAEIRGLANDAERWLLKRKFARVAETCMPRWAVTAVRPIGSWLVGR